MHGGSAIRAFLLLLLPALLCAAPRSGAPTTTEYVFHSVVPLGAEGFKFRDAHETMFLLATAANPRFEGWRRIVDHGRRQLVDANGAPVLAYPDTVTFRITASTRLKLLDVDQWPETAGQDLNRYLLGLRFRVRVFHGLSQRVLQPDSVQLIGMPSTVSYDERIYRATFHLGGLPMTDRLVLEVLSPKGERLSRFHLDLQ
jgi:hypothetical protein